MSEIEKMYENVRIKKEIIPCPAKYYGYNCTRNNWDDEDCSCDIEGYPPFTAEKQINLTQKLWELKPNVYPNFDLLTDYSYSEMIAELTNRLWQDLTKEEKQQVKGILE